jgi:hypothetical protein
VSGTYCRPRRPPGDERLGVLVVVVVRRGGRDDLAGRETGAVLHRHDADVVGVGVAESTDHNRAEALDLLQLLLPTGDHAGLVAALVEFVALVLGDHDEQGGVDRVHAFAEDRTLAATLPSGSPLQKHLGVLVVVAVHHPAERLPRTQRLSVAGINVADLALGNGDQRGRVNAVLPPPEPQVDAAAEQPALVTGLAVQGDDLSLGNGAGLRPELLDHPDFRVRDVSQPQKLLDRHNGQHDRADQKAGRNQQTHHESPVSARPPVTGRLIPQGNSLGRPKDCY